MPVIFPPIPPIRFSPPDDPSPEMDPRARRWAMFCHLTGFLVFGFVTALLIIWLAKRIMRDIGHPFVEDQGQEAIHFQTTMLVALVLMALAPAPGLVLLLLVVDVAFMVIAAREARAGRHYRYPHPLTIVRLIK